MRLAISFSIETLALMMICCTNGSQFPAGRDRRGLPSTIEGDLDLVAGRDLLPDDLVVIRMADLQPVDASLPHGGKREAPFSVRADRGQGRKLAQEVREDEGERLLRQVLELSPDAAGAHHALGLLLVRRGGIDEAVEYLAAASNSQPGNERFGYIYGVALNSMGDSSNALLMLERSLGYNPNSRNLLMALATINRDSGALNAALRYTEALLAIPPQDPSVIQLRAQLQEMIQSQSN